MPKCPTRQLARKRISQAVRWAGAPFKIQICPSGVILCPLSFSVQTNHSCLIQGAFQVLQCCDCVRARGRSEQEDRLIFRKEVKVVFEDEQIILLYFCIRRVGVLYSNRSVHKRAVAKGVIDADDILLWQPVALAQRPPAILPLKKFVCQPEFELGISL